MSHDELFFGFDEEELHVTWTELLCRFVGCGDAAGTRQDFRSI